MLRVLIIDDDDATLEVASALLEAEGYEVTVYNTGFGSSAKIMRDQPDIVLVDIEMPGLNGDDVIRLLKAQAGSRVLPSFVFYSGRPQEELRELVFQTGASGSIQKSASHEQFVAQFRNFADVRRARVSAGP